MLRAPEVSVIGSNDGAVSRARDSTSSSNASFSSISSNVVRGDNSNSAGTTTSINTSTNTSKSSITSCWTDADFGMARVPEVNNSEGLGGMSVSEVPQELGAKTDASGLINSGYSEAMMQEGLTSDPLGVDEMLLNGFSTRLSGRDAGSGAIGGQAFHVSLTGVEMLRDGPIAPPPSSGASVFANEEEIRGDTGTVVGTFGFGSQPMSVPVPRAPPATTAQTASMVSPFATNSGSQIMQGGGNHVQVSSATASVSSPPLQKQVHQRPSNSTNQPIICVPNQQAPYPHIQSQARLGKGPVVKHLTTAPITAQRTPHIQHIQHVHKFQQKPGGGIQVQTQQVGSGGVHPHLRHLQHHQMVPNQRFMQVGSSRSHVHSGHVPGRIPHLQSQTHSQKPLQMPRSMPAGVMGQMSASASPHPSVQYQSKALGGKAGLHSQPNVAPANNGAYGKLIPVFLSQGGPNSGMDNHGRDSVSVVVSDRKVRLLSENDASSLYSLCRRWVRSGFPRKEHIGFFDYPVPLPRPLSAEQVEKTCKQNEDSCEVEFQGNVENMSEAELLEQHISHFKAVRKRLRDQRAQKIARYKERLRIIL